MLGADADGGPLGRAVAFAVVPLGVNPLPGVRLDAVELEPLVFLGVLHAGLPQVLNNHPPEVVRADDLRAARALETDRQVFLLLHADRAVRREALHGERAGHTDPFLVLVGLIVEDFGAMDASISCWRLQRRVHHCSRSAGGLLEVRRFQGFPQIVIRVVGGQVTRNFPFLPGLLEELVELVAKRIEILLPAGVDRVNLFVVGDGLEGDVGDAAVDEALTDVGWSVRRLHR